jgi:hypothetical protein
MMFPAQLAVTPVGKPAAVPIPVALTVLCVKLVIAVFCVTDGLDEAALTEQAGADTVMVPVAFKELHPVPVKGME